MLGTNLYYNVLPPVAAATKKAIGKAVTTLAAKAAKQVVPSKLKVMIPNDAKNTSVETVLKENIIAENVLTETILR